jgi:hypothetical protein
MTDSCLTQQEAENEAASYVAAAIVASMKTGDDGNDHIVTRSKKGVIKKKAYHTPRLKMY